MSLYIDGQWTGGKGEQFSSSNPATGDLVWQGASSSPDQVHEAIAAARRAQKEWRLLTFEERADGCLRFGAQLALNKNSLAEAISEEMGKTLWESLQEVQSMKSKVDISIQAYNERCQSKRKESGSNILNTRYHPHGVMAVFGPFNFPGHLPNGHIIPALLAGNTILFKPSELTPKVAHLVTECWQRASLPRGVFNLLQGPKEVATTLVSSKEVNGICFTGSVAAGQSIARQSLAFPGRILALEMGGNNPLIVSFTKNINAALFTIIQSAFLTSGQRCTCARRLILIENRQTELLLEALIERARALKIGAYTEIPEPYMGPVVSAQAKQKLLDAFHSLVKKGAKTCLPLESIKERGNFLSPGIVDVTGCDQDDMEHFGPLLQCIRVQNLDEACAIANNSAFGLSAGLISDSPIEYKHFYEEIQAGVINWNTPLTGASSLTPFGGIKESGNHRPSAYFACDYCVYPVASQEAYNVHLPDTLPPGMVLSPPGMVLS